MRNTWYFVGYSFTIPNLLKILCKVETACSFVCRIIIRPERLTRLMIENRCSVLVLSVKYVIWECVVLENVLAINRSCKLSFWLSSCYDISKNIIWKTLNKTLYE